MSPASFRFHQLGSYARWSDRTGSRFRFRFTYRFAKTKNARDSTKCGEARVSPRSYYTHHTQRISAAAVRADAKNARVQIACLKQCVCAAA